MITAEEVQKEFKQLNENQRFTLGIAVAERMLPHYKAFSKKYSFGNMALLENAIKNLKNKVLSIEKADLLEKIEEIAPDTEEFPNNLMATAALDTVAIIYELVLMSSDASLKHLENIFLLAINAPYMCVHSKNKESYENPKMQAELLLFKSWTTQILSGKNIEPVENEWIKIFF